MLENKSVISLVILALFNGYLLAKAPIYGAIFLFFTAAYADSLQAEAKIDSRAVSKVVAIGLVSAFLLMALMYFISYPAYSIAK